MSIAKTEECGGGDAVVVLDGSLIETNNNNTTTFNKLNELKSIDLAANNNNKNNNSAVVSALLTANNNSTSNSSSSTNGKNSSNKTDTMFTLKRWNLVAMWSWDVECEVCAICRTPLMDSCLKCQTDNKHEDCVGKQPKQAHSLTVKHSLIHLNHSFIHFFKLSGVIATIRFTIAACRNG